MATEKTFRLPRSTPRSFGKHLDSLSKASSSLVRYICVGFPFVVWNELFCRYHFVNIKLDRLVLVLECDTVKKALRM